MPCIDSIGPGRWRAALAMLLCLSGCASPPVLPAQPAPAATVLVTVPVLVPVPPAVRAGPGAPAVESQAAPQIAAPMQGAARPPMPPRFVKLGPANTPRSFDELRLQAARRLVAAHPDTSYQAAPPPILLAIPILEIELNADGTVRHINVIRVPDHAQDTTQLAIDAVRRAAPFGDVSRLKRPWKFVEVFLFDDERRFMPRTLDRW